jgi:hypothetical protein
MMPSLKQSIGIAIVVLVASFIFSRVKMIDELAYNTNGAYWF